MRTQQQIGCSAAGLQTDTATAPRIEIDTRSGMPVGPKFWPRLLRGDVFRSNGADFLRANAVEFGDLVYFQNFGVRLLQCNHPELIQEMLVRDAGHHHRGLVMQRSRMVLGEGLLTSEEPLHMRQRRLAQPAFHRERIAAYGEVIGEFARRMTGQWTEAGVVEVHSEMLLLALRIVGKTLFDTNVEQEVESIAEAVDAFMGFLPLAFLPMSHLIQQLPLPLMRRIRRGQERLDTLFYRMIAERRASPEDRGDLLSMLLMATDEESQEQGYAERMTDRQVRDECLTVLLAGHETTANALTFALWLLATHPEVQQRAAAEAQQVLKNPSQDSLRGVSSEDYGRLPYLGQVFAEAMRLYPPVWVTARTAAEEYLWRGIRVQRGTILIAPQYAVHRDERWYPEPDRFDPERFTAVAKAARPRLAYFPFAAGSRQCIGEGLARMEGVLILATILADWELTPESGAGTAIAVQPAITLRPAGPVKLVVRRRQMPDSR